MYSFLPLKYLSPLTKNLTFLGRRRSRYLSSVTSLWVWEADTFMLGQGRLDIVSVIWTALNIGSKSPTPQYDKLMMTLDLTASTMSMVSFFRHLMLQQVHHFSIILQNNIQQQLVCMHSNLEKKVFFLIYTHSTTPHLISFLLNKGPFQLCILMKIIQR